MEPMCLLCTCSLDSCAQCRGVSARLQDGYTVLDVRKNATRLVPPPAVARLGLLQPTSFRGDFRYLAMASGGDPQRLLLWDTVRNDTLMIGEGWWCSVSQCID